MSLRSAATKAPSTDDPSSADRNVLNDPGITISSVRTPCSSGLPDGDALDGLPLVHAAIAVHLDEGDLCELRCDRLGWFGLVEG
jgi:hypothetical protein